MGKTEEFLAFVYWLGGQSDLEAIDTTKRLLKQIIVFAGYRFGGQEYERARERLSDLARKAIQLADAIEPNRVPIDIRILAGCALSSDTPLKICRNLADSARKHLGLKPAVELAS
ncbi:MAG: hypothetical protein ACOYUZ_01750 [Patescibacteria group bacterium]